MKTHKSTSGDHFLGVKEEGVVERKRYENLNLLQTMKSFKRTMALISIIIATETRTPETLEMASTVNK